MKKLASLTIVLAIFGFTNAFSQTVNNVPIKDIDVDYIQILGTPKYLSNNLMIEIDFGQENMFWSAKDTQVKDENGKLVDFNSMIDALNFLSKNGYEFVDAFSMILNNQNVYHYLLKKKEEQNLPRSGGK